MPLTSLTTPEGTRFEGFICGGRQRRRFCFVCGAPSTKQCDFLMQPKPSKRRCNRHLCDAHATVLGPDKDACPTHAPICLAAIERRAAYLAARSAS